jgi:hypothetical protein
MACRSGCPTQDHESWGDCLRASNIQMSTGDANGSLVSNGWTNKKWNSELSLYREARAQGIQPEGTSTAQIRKAMDVSDKTGHAFGSAL